MESKCSECGKALGANAIEGLCPECLMKVGLGSQPGTAGQGTAAPFTAPKPEELAAHFPQLDILELIGRGGMGAVYKARQKQLGRIVALKILPPGVGHEPAFAERFTREARALATLNHPGIVTLYEFGQTDGLFFFLMEYVDGVNLRQLLQAGRVAPREALAIVPQICDALQYAHDQGIVHRDIKPENILLDRKGRVKVADFGLARLMGLEPDSAAPVGQALSASLALTEAGKVMGTPQYMAPEQIGKPGEVDHRADIYSLGVVLYQMLTGELPDQRLEPPSRKVHLDVRLDEVVLRALEREPDRRYQQASQLKTQIENLAGGAAPPIIGTPGPALHPAAPAANAHLSRTALVGAVWAPLFFITGVTYFWASASRAVSPGMPLPGPPWWVQLLKVTLLPLGLLAPFGTTILGWVAVTQIRHSVGRLYGLGLAVFDGLLFPLLLLDSAILVVVALGVSPALGTWLIQHGHEPSRKAVLLMLVALALALCLVVDWLLCRTVWRTVTKPLSGLPPTPGPGAGQGTPAQTSSSPLASVAVWFAVLSGLLGILCFCSLPHPPGGLVWPALVIAVVGLLLGIATRQTRGGKLALVIGCANTVIWVVVLVLANIMPATLSAPAAVELADANQSPVTPQVARASGPEVSAAASSNSESPEVLTKLLTDFPYGIWNKPLAHFARNRRPDAWFALINFPPIEDSWVSPAAHAFGRQMDLNLPADAPGERVAEKAGTGDIYVPDLDHLVPVRGTKLAPLKTKPLPPDVRPADADQSTLLQVLDYRTRPEIAAAIEAYDAAHPDDKWVRLQPGGRYGALRPDGKLLLITAFGAADDLSIQMIPVGKRGQSVPPPAPAAPGPTEETTQPIQRSR